MERGDLKGLLRTEDGTRRMVRQCLETVETHERTVIFGAGVGGVNCMSY